MNRSKALNRWPLAMAVPLWLVAWPAVGQDDAFDRTPQDCLPVNAIRRTHVLDDQTILFYMRGKKAYRNYLPRECPGLERWDRFMYEVRSGRLCSIDTITVLEQWGARLERGFTCRLGEFHPVSLEEAEDLDIDVRKDGPGPGAIESHPVELPPDPAPEADAAPSATADE